MLTGDLVWFVQTVHGGYGFQQRVPGVFLHATARRLVIEVLARTGQRKNIAVHPRNVIARAAGESIEWNR